MCRYTVIRTTASHVCLVVDGLVARLDVSKCVWPYMLSICSVYFVTLSLFPGIESEIVSCRLASWMPVVLFAVFNLFDFIGKVRRSWLLLYIHSQCSWSLILS